MDLEASVAQQTKPRRMRQLLFVLFVLGLMSLGVPVSRGFLAKPVGVHFSSAPLPPAPMVMPAVSAVLQNTHEDHPIGVPAVVARGISTSSVAPTAVQVLPRGAAPEKMHVNVARAAVEAREGESGCRQSLLSLGNFDQITAGLRNVCPSTPPGVSMQCSHRNMRDVHETLCRLRGAVLDMHAVTSYATSTAFARPHKQHIPELPEPPAGLLLLPCHGSANAEVFSRGNVGHGGQEWLLRTLTVQPAETPLPLCEAWVDTSLYIMADTYDPVNVWHAFEDVTHAFEAYGGLGVDDRHSRVVIADLPLNPATNAKQDLVTYSLVWQAAFSGGVPPTSLARLVLDPAALEPVLEHGSISPALQKALHANKLKEFWSSLTPSGQRRGLCLRDAVFSVHGGVSVMTREESHCPRSSFMRGLLDHIQARLPVTGHTRARHGSILRVTYARRDVGGFGSQNVGAGRGFADEGPIIDALKALSDVDVLAVDPGSLTLEQQYALFRSTDVLVGLHGAALAWGLFIAEPGGLVEVQVGSFRCTCFTGISQWRDLSYQLVTTGSHQDVHGVIQPIVTAVTTVIAEIRALKK